MLCGGSFRRKRGPDEVYRKLVAEDKSPGEGAEEKEEGTDLEGSLRARVYRRRHTVVIVCRTDGLDKVSSINSNQSTVSSNSSSSNCGSGAGVTLRPLSSDLHPPKMDTYRFSLVNMEESQDVDLDAILGELNALDSQFEEALQSSKPECKEENLRNIGLHSGGGRTHSPDNDSAFSDCVSLLSSESTSSSGRSTTAESHIQSDLSNSKAEKIKLALQKMKDASVKKLFVKVFNKDGSAKCLLVDEGMTCGYVTRILAEKNHIPLDPTLALVEQLTDLHMERVYEDDEPLVDQLMQWTRDSKNRLLFCTKSAERTALFNRPALFLTPTDTPPTDSFTNNKMLEEFFSGNGVPSIEGPLYLKTDSKKGWKRHHCVLRASGLYYWPKEKSKSSSKDLVCLSAFDNNHVYYGVGWKKKYKSPTDHCFAIKHPAIQQLTNKSSKYIKYLCADDEVTMLRWVTAIRVIKSGRQLLVNYKGLMEESTMEEPLVDSDSGSSGCDMAFEADFPQGTIKRKPPKLPLTATTRQLKEIAIGTPVFEEERALDVDGLPPPPPELLEPPTMEYPEPPPPPPPPRTVPRQSHIFLQDLARVMSKKWQVAQKCKMEEGTSPHEVLGFRDPDHYANKENSVSQWVAEHYGGADQFPALYENVYRSSSSATSAVVSSAPMTQLGPIVNAQSRPSVRRPPPPPPRAVTTHLTTVQQNS